ncbi:MAG: family 10 glycosylhydrolase [Bacteroidota bacterium]
MKQSLFLLLGTLVLSSCISSKYSKSAPETEFRGVWIATVVNIDWPKHPEDAIAKKKQDFLEILDFYQNLNFNAAIVQIRTAGDAFYATKLAPWSKYLTGKEGNTYQGDENPLEWMIEETHKRGMQFHAWLNPYRATFDLDTLSLAPTHDYYQHPDWMVRYGKKYYYNPGQPEVRKKFTAIVGELVDQYELDAIHFDDYFYPYKIKGEMFSDSLTYKKHALPNQKLDDWRRSNVDSLVKQVDHAIKTRKPWVQFGISPFGVWKNKSTDPKGSDTRAGQTTYEDLYADPLLWMNKGWLDYIAPQAYWSMDYPAAGHRIITQWWSQTLPQSNIYMGNGTYKIKNNKDEAWKKNQEIPNQIVNARQDVNINGNIFFSAKSLIGKHKKVNRILRKVYATPSKNPMPSKPLERDLTALQLGEVKSYKEKLSYCITHQDSIPRFVLLYALKGNEKAGANKTLLEKNYLSPNETEHCFDQTIPKGYRKFNLGVSVRDAYGNESPIQLLNSTL